MSKDEIRLPPKPAPTSTSPQRKVVAATAGAGLGVQAADFVNWCVGSLWFTPDTVPGPVSAFVYGLVTAAAAFAGGYFVSKAPGE